MSGESTSAGGIADVAMAHFYGVPQKAAAATPPAQKPFFQPAPIKSAGETAREQEAARHQSWATRGVTDAEYDRMTQAERLAYAQIRTRARQR
ncbi:hypothetical protein SLNSH_16995 [Alsobacter soli]|uniref:Uncharacterized protein n=1 Tax=Alsobacter soli TaxID=2109933 RepID=A0A2T1HQ90_9HYPH|nr:hypothetical protein [Alsobacter soli]PSC03806.1 hypothetical protein SLNSH_16995 [Alsobacter soli]